MLGESEGSLRFDTLALKALLIINVCLDHLRGEWRHASIPCACEALVKRGIPFESRLETVGLLAARLSGRADALRYAIHHPKLSLLLLEALDGLASLGPEGLHHWGLALLDDGWQIHRPFG